MNIDKIKMLLAAPLSLHMAYELADADGKVDVKDLPFLMDPLMKLIPAIGAAKEAVEQLKTMDDESRMAVNKWAQETYDIADDVLEAKVEAGIDWMLSTARMLGVLGVIGGGEETGPTPEAPAE